MVAPSTSARTRDGCRSATSWAIMPPSEMPYTCADSTPAASSTATASSAISATVYGPGTRSDRPTPRLSKAMTRNSESTGIVRHQPVAFIPSPMIRRTGGPSPPVSWK